MSDERFDRIRPRGRGVRGREALFSSGEASPSGAASGDAPGRLSLHCSRCDAATALDAGVALRAAIPVFLVLPWRAHPIFALCPACDRRAWLRLSGGGAGAAPAAGRGGRQP